MPLFTTEKIKKQKEKGPQLQKVCAKTQCVSSYTDQADKVNNEKQNQSTPYIHIHLEVRLSGI